MARFTVRIELHTKHKVYDHLNHPVYSFLNHAMEEKGFSTTIETGGLKQLPRADYMMTGEFTSIQVLRVVKKICETTNRDYTVLVCKTSECMGLGLKPMNQTVRVSRCMAANLNEVIQPEERDITDITTKNNLASLGAEELPARLENIIANLQKTRIYLNGIADVVKKNRAVLARTRAIIESTRIDDLI